jgi:hypothetical protein
MSTKIMAAAVAAAFVMSSGSVFAAAMDHDPTTGLNTYYYYGPVSELAKKGLPMKDGSSKSPSQSSARRQRPAVVSSAARKSSDACDSRRRSRKQQYGRQGERQSLVNIVSE